MHHQIRLEIDRIQSAAEHAFSIGEDVDHEEILKSAVERYEKLYVTHRSRLTVDALTAMISGSVKLAVNFTPYHLNHSCLDPRSVWAY